MRGGGARRTGRRRRSAGSRSPSSPSRSAAAVGAKADEGLGDRERRVAPRRADPRPGQLQDSGARERARAVADARRSTSPLFSAAVGGVVQTLSQQPDVTNIVSPIDQPDARPDLRATGTRRSSSSTSRARPRTRRTRSRRSSPRSTACRRGIPSVIVEEFGQASADYQLEPALRAATWAAPRSPRCR